MRRTFALAALAISVSLAFPGRTADEDPVVVRVGKDTIRRSQIAERLSAVPAFQLSALARTPAEARQAFVKTVLVEELLFAAGAEARKLSERPDVRRRLDDALRAATMGALREEVAKRGVTPEDVAKYYADNQPKFQTPERILLHRIVVRTKGEAESILAVVMRPGGEKQWRELARDKSLDKATYERGGDVGFIDAEGKSNQPLVKVEPELFAAAKRVRNGEFVPQPVSVGDAFAVVWRRGSTPAVHRKLEDEEAPIRALLLRARTEAAVTETLESLRKAQVRDVAYDSLGLVELEQMGARDPGARRVMSAEPRTPKSPEPRPGADGLR